MDRLTKKIPIGKIYGIPGILSYSKSQGGPMNHRAGLFENKLGGSHKALGLPDVKSLGIPRARGKYPKWLMGS